MGESLYDQQDEQQDPGLSGEASTPAPEASAEPSPAMPACVQP